MPSPYDTHNQTVRIPLVMRRTDRDFTGNNDRYIQNMYIDALEEDKMVLVKRPGLTEETSDSTCVPNGDSGGVFWWENGNTLYRVVNNTLYETQFPVTKKSYVASLSHPESDTDTFTSDPETGTFFTYEPGGGPNGRHRIVKIIPNDDAEPTIEYGYEFPANNNDGGNLSIERILALPDAVYVAAGHYDLFEVKQDNYVFRIDKFDLTLLTQSVDGVDNADGVMGVGGNYVYVHSNDVRNGSIDLHQFSRYDLQTHTEEDLSVGTATNRHPDSVCDKEGNLWALLSDRAADPDVVELMKIDAGTVDANGDGSGAVKTSWDISGDINFWNGGVSSSEAHNGFIIYDPKRKCFYIGSLHGGGAGTGPSKLLKWDIASETVTGTLSWPWSEVRLGNNNNIPEINEDHLYLSKTNDPDGSVDGWVKIDLTDFSEDSTSDLSDYIVQNPEHSCAGESYNEFSIRQEDGYFVFHEIEDVLDGSNCIRVGSHQEDDDLSQATCKIVASFSDVLLVDFEELQVTETSKLLVKGGNVLYTVDRDGTFTQVTDSDYPNDLVPGLTVLDGYAFVMDKEGTVYNSDLEDPSSWNALNYVTAERLPDAGQYLTRLNNYIVAIGTTTTEYFYNAANATGSPLTRIEQAYYNIGTKSPYSVASDENSLFWIGYDANDDYSIIHATGLRMEQISEPKINRILRKYSQHAQYHVGNVLQAGGHTFYILQIANGTEKTDYIRTLVYDVESQAWYEWYTADDGVFPVLDVTNYNAAVLIQDVETNKLYKIDENIYQDLGEDFTCLVRTEVHDIETEARKFIHRLRLVSDKTSVSGAEASIRWTDDRYQNWSSARTVPLTAKSSLTRLGYTDYRAFEVFFSGNFPMRLDALELSLSIGHYTG